MLPVFPRKGRKNSAQSKWLDENVCECTVLAAERGSIVIRAHASKAEGLKLEPDSMP